MVMSDGHAGDYDENQGQRGFHEVVMIAIANGMNDDYRGGGDHHCNGFGSQQCNHQDND